MEKGELWLEEGTNPPYGVHVVEGPAINIDGRVPVQLLCTTSAQIGPGTRAIQIRRKTKKDEAILKAINRCDQLQASRDSAINACQKEAAEAQLAEEKSMTEESRKATSKERLLNVVYGLRASYKTRGTLTGKSNKARKQELFPELEKKIKEARREMNDTKVPWPDQSSEKCKDH